MTTNGAEMNLTYLSIDTLCKYVPETILPEHHPSHIAVFRVIKRILEAGHLNFEDKLWALGIIVSNAPIPAGNRVQYAGITGLVAIDSAILSSLENEGALAGFLSKKLAPLVLRYHEEKLSHRRFLLYAPMPAVPLIITSVVKRKLLVVVIPYAAAYAAAWWSFRKLHSEFENESNYVAFRLTRQLGYDLNDYTRYLENTINDNEQMLREQRHHVAKEFGPNLPVEVEEDIRKAVELMEEQRAKFQKLKKWVPEIMAKTANDAIIPQESRKIPLPMSERRGDPPQQTE